METEKVTMNLNPLELGKMDLLTEHGLYSNRSDFIRTAIREKLEKHDEDIKRYLHTALPGVNEIGAHPVYHLSTIGVSGITVSDLERLQEQHGRYRITVVGVLHVDKKISPALFEDTIASVRVYGACVASDEIKALIAKMNTR